MKYAYLIKSCDSLDLTLGIFSSLKKAIEFSKFYLRMSWQLSKETKIEVAKRGYLNLDTTIIYDKSDPNHMGKMIKIRKMEMNNLNGIKGIP